MTCRSSINVRRLHRHADPTAGVHRDAASAAGRTLRHSVHQVSSKQSAQLLTSLQELFVKNHASEYPRS